MADIKVVIYSSADIPAPDLSGISQRLDVEVVFPDVAERALRDADAVVFWKNDPQALRKYWASFQNLQWVHSSGAGIEKFLFDDFKNSEVLFTNSQGIFDHSIAEHVLAEVLAFAKHIRMADRNQQHASWQKYETSLIRGKRCLIYGTGAVGRAIARLLKATGIEVAAVGRTPRQEDPDFGVVFGGEELLPQAALADYVVVCAPLTDETRGIIDWRFFSTLRKGALLVNVARGAMVNTADMIRALDEGHLAAAALDVFEQEPLSEDSTLWQHPGVAITPHIAGDDVDWRNRINQQFVTLLNLWAEGQELFNVVDKQLGYVPRGGSQ